jgi:hypothetical protein
MPFHLTVEVDTKFEPLTVKVNAGPPALAALGLMLLSTGLVAVTVKLKILVVVCGVG